MFVSGKLSQWLIEKMIVFNNNIIVSHSSKTGWLMNNERMKDTEFFLFKYLVFWAGLSVHLCHLRKILTLFVDIDEFLSCICGHHVWKTFSSCNYQFCTLTDPSGSVSADFRPTFQTGNQRDYSNVAPWICHQGADDFPLKSHFMFSDANWTSTVGLS